MIILISEFQCLSISMECDHCIRFHTINLRRLEYLGGAVELPFSLAVLCQSNQNERSFVGAALKIRNWACPGRTR